MANVSQLTLNCFTKQMGDNFKQNYTKTDVWMITSSVEGLKALACEQKKNKIVLTVNSIAVWYIFQFIRSAAHR